MPGARAADPAAFLPLKPTAYLLLVALVERDCHAYALKKEAARRTDGRLRLGPGTLHRSLARLRDDGLIEESPDRPAPARDDERRRYYRLTPLGRKVALAETDRLSDLIATVRGVRWARPGRAAR